MNPIRKALKKQLKNLGQRLYNLLGNTNDMVKVAEDVANEKPRQWDYRINLIDKNWDGVGKGDDRWWA